MDFAQTGGRTWKWFAKVWLGWKGREGWQNIDPKICLKVLAFGQSQFEQIFHRAFPTNPQGRRSTSHCDVLCPQHCVIHCNTCDSHCNTFCETQDCVQLGVYL